MERIRTAALIILLSLVLLIGTAFTGCIDDDESDIEMSVTKVETRAEDMGGDPPPDGHILLYLNVSMENLKESGDVPADPSYFTVETEEGIKYEHHDYDWDEFPFFISAQETRYFWISYTINENETATDLIFEPFFFTEEDLYAADIPSYR